MKTEGVLGARTADELFEWALRGRVTGRLTLETDSESIAFELRSGAVTSGRTSDMGRLGEMLVERGILNDKTLQTALSMQRRKRKHEPLGHILRALGLASEFQIAAVLTETTRTCLERARVLENARWTIETE